MSINCGSSHQFVGSMFLCILFKFKHVPYLFKSSTMPFQILDLGQLSFNIKNKNKTKQKKQSRGYEGTSFSSFSFISRLTDFISCFSAKFRDLIEE